MFLLKKNSIDVRNSQLDTIGNVDQGDEKMENAHKC